jgi:hypothetical protein
MEETSNISLEVTREQELTIQALHVFAHWGWEYKTFGK